MAVNLFASIGIDADDMDVCYSVTYGTASVAWVRQIGPTLSVVKADQDNIVAITPTTFAATVTTDLFTITGAVDTGKRWSG